MADTQSTTVKDTKRFIIGDEYADEILTDIAQQSVIATLVPNKPQAYVNKKKLYMNKRPLAEYVQEGGPKGLSDWDYEQKQLYKFKVQTTVRMTEEVEWADEDNSLDLLDTVIGLQKESLSEAVDSGMIHQVSPLGGNIITDAADVALAKVTEHQDMSSDIIADVDSLPDIVIANGWTPTGIALDSMYANTLRKVRNPKTGAKEYPDINMNLDPGNFEGMKSVTSGNVSGRSIRTLGDTGLRSIVGDWKLAEWGVIREFVMRRFDTGDPDGTGRDLAHFNEVAYRLELVFAFGLWDAKAFSTYWDTSVIDDGGDDGDEGGGDTPSVQSTKASK